jgi:hypothetical protein
VISQVLGRYPESIPDDFGGRARRLEQNVKESIQARHKSQTKMGRKNKPSKPKLAKNHLKNPIFLRSDDPKVCLKVLTQIGISPVVFSPTP